jgi:hypothetical protein
MAKMEIVPVLAVARRALQVRNDLEYREFPLKNDKGLPAIDPMTGIQRVEVLPVWIPVMCEPGTIIDVSNWTNAGAYENRGDIQILGPVEAKQAWEALKKESAEQEAASPANRPLRQPTAADKKAFAKNEAWAGRVKTNA